MCYNQKEEFYRIREKNTDYCGKVLYYEKIASLKCPSCGAVLSDENSDVMFCKFCGSKLIIDNDNEHIYKNINVADVKRAETEQLVKLKELEMREKENEHKKELLKIKIKSSLALASIGIIMMILESAFGSASGSSDSAWYTIEMIGMFLLMGSAFIWLFSMKDNTKNEEEEVEEEEVEDDDDF